MSNTNSGIPEGFARQGNAIVPTGRRFFTGNFDALLKHDNQNQNTRYAKRMAKKQLKAYLSGHTSYGMMVNNPKAGSYGMEYFRVPQKWV
jgi:hypothetical protein